MIQTPRHYSVILILLSAALSCAQGKTLVNYLDFYSGKVEIIRPDKTVESAEVKKALKNDDMIKTAAESHADIHCGSGIKIRILESSEFRMVQLPEQLNTAESQKEFYLHEGGVEVNTGEISKKGGLKINTPSCAVEAVRETLFSVSYLNGITSVNVMKGSVAVSGNEGAGKKHLLQAGQKAVVKNGIIAAGQNAEADKADSRGHKPQPGISDMPKEKTKNVFEKKQTSDTDTHVAMSEKSVNAITRTVQKENIPPRAEKTYLKKETAHAPDHDKIIETRKEPAGKKSMEAGPVDLKYAEKNKTALNGFAVFTWPNGNRYEGEWKNGKMNGKGIMSYFNGDRFEGTWINGIRNGRGIYTWADGAKYSGEYKNDHKEGAGTLTWPRGSSYSGEWKRDRRNGYGIYKWPSGSRYEGQWKDDLKHGFGVFTWPGGAKYTGRYQNDKKHGNGTYRWSDGSAYSGTWNEGEIVTEESGG